jgi:hypothetical protein
MKRTTKRIRAKLLQIYLSARELELLQDVSRSQGLPLATWARVALLEQGSRLSSLDPPKRRRARKAK